MTSTVAIAGIGSKLALLIAQELLQHQDIHIRGSSRDISKIPNFLQDNPRVTLVQSEPFDRTSLRTLVGGSQVVVCCYFADNETMIKGQKLLIDLCEEQGIKRFVASDYTADYTKLDYGDIILKDAMKTVKEYLDQNTKVEGVHILVSLFMEIWNFLIDWDPEQKVLSYYGTGDEVWEFTSYRTTAQYVAAVILDPSAHGVLKFLGDRRTIKEIAQDYQAATGIEPTLKRLGGLGDLKQILDEEGKDNVLLASRYYVAAGKPALGTDLDNHRYPRVKPDKFVDFLRGQGSGA